jgi:hypothetical protein
VRALREEKVYQRNDERIFGDREFVGRALAAAEAAVEKHYAHMRFEPVAMILKR